MVVDMLLLSESEVPDSDFCTSLVSQPKSRRDDEPKIKYKKEIWSRHHSYYRKLWKTIKKSKVYENRDWGYGS